MEIILGYLDKLFALSPKAYAVHSLIVILLSIFMAYAVSVIMKLFARFLEKTNKLLWDDVLVRALIGPTVIFILVTGIFRGVEISGVFNVESLNAILPIGKKLAMLFAMTWFLLAYINYYTKAHVISKKLRKQAVDFRTIDPITKVVKLIVVILAIVVGMDMIGLDMRAIITFLGVGGVSLAFATKDLASSFFGTAVIYSDKPFLIGDLISVPSQNIEGYIEEIGWRVTKIRTKSRTLMYIPNSVFSNFTIENMSNRSHRHINMTIPLRYKDASKVAAIAKKIEAMLWKYPQIDQNQPLFVSFDKFDNGAIEIIIYAYSSCLDKMLFYKVKQDIILKAIDIILKHKASLGYPTQVISGEHYGRGLEE